MNILVVIVVLGVVIFVHELGHFIAAKAIGVQVLRFSIGFGPPILSWRRGETEYWLAWIPLGGYVKMAGLEEEEMTGKLEGGPGAVPIDPARTLESKPVWARLVVMVAGVTMNVVLAFFIYTGINLTGSPEPAMLPVDTVVGDSLPASARGLSELSGGGVVLRVNGDTLTTLRDFERWITRGPDTLRLDVAGRLDPLIVRLPRDAGVRTAAWRALTPRIPPTVSILVPGEPAHRAGLRPGDEIVRVGADSVVSWRQLTTIIRASRGDSLQLGVRRGEERLQITLAAREQTERVPGDSSVTYWRIGANPNPPTVSVPRPLGQAVVEGVQETAARTWTVVGFLGNLVTGQISAREVGGVVLIAQLSGQAAQLGAVWLLGIVAFISLNLAVLNLLPIPVLDGGHVMFLLVEAVRGRPVSLAVRLRLTQVGFVVLIALMILAVSNDVLRNVGR